VDLANKVVFIDDSKTPTGVAEAPLTDISVEAFSSQVELAGPGRGCSPATATEPGTDRVQEGLGNRSCAQVFAFPSLSKNGNWIKNVVPTPPSDSKLSCAPVLRTITD